MQRNLSAILVVLFVSLIVLVSADTIYRLAHDDSIRGVDTDSHVCFTQDMYYQMSDIMHSPRLAWYEKIPALIGLLKTPMPYSSARIPNLVYMVSAGTCLLFGKSLFVIKMSNFVSIFILLISVYLLGKELSSPLVGLTACCFLMLFPIINQISLQYGQDLPLAAVVAFSMYLLIKSDLFTRWGYSLAFGVTSGFGVLVKIPFVAFLCGGTLIVFAKVFLEFARNGDRRLFVRRMLAGSLALFLAAAISAFLWWGNRIFFILNECRYYTGELSTLFPGFHDSSYHMLFALFNASARYAIGYPVLVMFLVSFAVFVVSTDDNKYLYVAWFVSPCIFFAFIAFNTSARQLIPALPCVALVLAWAVYRVRRAWMRWSFLALLLTIFGVHYVVSSPILYPPLHRPSRWEGWLPVYSDYYNVLQDRRSHRIDGLLAAMNGILPEGGQKRVIMVSLVTTEDRLRQFQMRYYFREKYSTCDFYDLINMPLPATSLAAYREFDAADSIIFALPDEVSVKEWPDMACLAEWLPKSPHGLSYQYFIVSSVGKPLLAKLAGAKRNFTLRSIVPVPKYGYSWVIYEKRMPRDPEGHSLRRLG